MALVIQMHLEADGHPCQASPSGVVIEASEREINLDGQLAGRLEVDCDSNRTVRIDVSTDGQQTWAPLFAATPPLVDSCSRTRLFPIPVELRTVVWIRAALVGGNQAVCRLINFETLDAI